MSVCRGGSRTAATSKMERFVIIVNGWKPLTIITKRSILNVAAVPDLPLVCLKTYLINHHFGRVLWFVCIPFTFLFFFYNQKQPFRGVLKKSVLKICSKFTGEHPYQSVISIKLLFNFIEIALRHRCSPVNLLHIFKTPFSRNTFGWLLLYNIDLHLANRDQHNTLENQTNIQQQKNKIWTILTQHWLKSWCV